MRKRYHLNQSPLFRLERRKDLSELLGVPAMDLESLANGNPPTYAFFDKQILREGKPPKIRHVEWPMKPLQRVQRRLAVLLDRVEPPEYLHSAFRGRSYLTNAQKHPTNTRLATIDIRNFFPSASAYHVKKCFLENFKCSPDVAALLTKLTTIHGHIPTGGSTSTIISFYAFKPMFDEIWELAKLRGLIMSCCVDDMTFSGDEATSAFLNEVRCIVKRYGLKVHKRHCFEKPQTKVVTGVALTPQGPRLPNRRRRLLHEAFERFEQEVSLTAKVKLGEKLLGRATEAAQVESGFRGMVRLAAEKLDEARINLARATMQARYRRLFGNARADLILQGINTAP